MYPVPTAEIFRQLSKKKLLLTLNCPLWLDNIAYQPQRKTFMIKKSMLLSVFFSLLAPSMAQAAPWAGVPQYITCSPHGYCTVATNTAPPSDRPSCSTDSSGTMVFDNGGAGGIAILNMLIDARARGKVAYIFGEDACLTVFDGLSRQLVKAVSVQS